MTLDTPTPISEMDELDMPERKSGVRRKRPGTEASPHFNKLPRLQRKTTREEREVFGRIVKQPEPIAWMQHPTRPPGK